MSTTTAQPQTFAERIDRLRATKAAQTAEKQRVRGAMNFDDHGIVLPPEAMRESVHTISSSGIEFTDVRIAGFEPCANHPSGAFFGARASGENFRALLQMHPVYVDPASSLAGAYMVNFASYRKLGWKPEIDRGALDAAHAHYQTVSGIGAMQHMCQDMAIGLELGWGGLLKKVRHYRDVNGDAEGLYAGLEQVVLGVQEWIARHAAEARSMGLDELARINEHLVDGAPRTFHEACQWLLWYLLVARMYNGSGAMGKMDALLEPYYTADIAAGRLSDEEAIFHIACLLVRDTCYAQIGGPDKAGRDVTSPVSFLILEAAHRLRIPCNIGVAVGEGVDPNLLRRGVEILIEDRCGVPKFLGVDNTISGFVRNGFSLEAARERAYSGCHWSGVPGREYGIMDIIKINLAAVFDVALRDMLRGEGEASLDALWSCYEKHLRQAIALTAEGIDLHYRHMHEVFPELVLDLLCHGPIEKGLDASNGGVDYYTFGVDGAALATVADSLAAMEEQIAMRHRLSWQELAAALDSNWTEAGGERTRLLMKNVPHFGAGGSRADAWAARVNAFFSEAVREKPTPDGHMMLPGLFSWASAILLGSRLGATPNGRRAGEPISHGANPDPGFRTDGALTALAAAVANVQPGYGNTAPLQLDLDPTTSTSAGDVRNVMSLIQGHFDLGGTQINANILDRKQVMEAHRDPSRFPDLIVRVTGFSAYFASLSEDLRQLVVDRIVAAD